MSIRSVIVLVALMVTTVVVGFFIWPGQTWSERMYGNKEIPYPRKRYTSSQPQAGMHTTNPLHGKVFKNWVVQCETAPNSQKESCFATQSQISAENKARILKFSVGPFGPKKEWVAVAILPLGIALSKGVAFRVDEQPQVRMQLQQCTNEGCVASVALDKKHLASMKTGTVLNMGMVPFGSSKTLVINVSLIGFSAAMSTLSR